MAPRHFACPPLFPARGARFTRLQVVECIFALDIALHFRLGFVALGRLGQPARCVMGPRAIAARYMRTWFWIDLAAVLPWQYLLLSSAAAGEEGSPVFPPPSLDLAKITERDWLKNVLWHATPRAKAQGRKAVSAEALAARPRALDGAELQMLQRMGTGEVLRCYA